MTPRYGKADLVQHEIVQVLRQTGCSVAILTVVGGGFPDILAARSGASALIEIKTGKGKLSEEQKDWHDRWKAKIYIVRTVDEALNAMSDAVRRHGGGNV